MEFEGVADGFEYRLRRQQGFDVVFVQQQQFGIAAHTCLLMGSETDFPNIGIQGGAGKPQMLCHCINGTAHFQ